MADGRQQVVRVGTAALAASSLVVGSWALTSPQSFYDDFPGGGRSWVAADGPFNEHLVRDVGGLNLALALVLGWAAWSLARPLLTAALAAAAVFALPHFAYHLAHLDSLDRTADQVAQTVSLGLGALGPLVLLVIAPHRRRPVDVTTARNTGS